LKEEVLDLFWIGVGGHINPSVQLKWWWVSKHATGVDFFHEVHESIFPNIRGAPYGEFRIRRNHVVKFTKLLVAARKAIMVAPVMGKSLQFRDSRSRF
jgi:hypothetical protein